MAKLSFTDHPATVGETYTEHFGMSWGFGFAMLRGGLACLVHGIFPFLCTSTGSQTIRELHHRMVTHRVRSPETAASQQAQG